jgi:hypothetical protein
MIPGSGQRPIIDSGSSFTYVLTGVHNGMKQSFEAFCQASGGKKCRGTRNPPGTVMADIRDSIACFSPPAGVGSSQDQIDDWLTSDFPTIEIEFASGPNGKPARICISPRSYFWLSTPASQAWCIGIFPDAKVVIGAISMAEFTVIFDADRKRVGWARSDCDGDGKASQICCGNGRGGTCGMKSPKPTGVPTSPLAVGTSSDITPTSVTMLVTDVPTSASVGTASPSREPKPKGFWQGDPIVLSGYFFFVGIFATAFMYGAWWFCCAKRNQVSFKAMNQVEPIQEYDSDLEEEEEEEDGGDGDDHNDMERGNGHQTKEIMSGGIGSGEDSNEKEELVNKRKSGSNSIYSIGGLSTSSSGGGVAATAVATGAGNGGGGSDGLEIT